MPNSWPWKPLGALLRRPLAYGVLKPGPNTTGGIPLVRIQDIHSGSLDPEEMHRISKALDAQYERTRLEGGELLFSLVGTLGEVVVVPSEMRGANISRALCVIGPNDAVDPHFLKYHLQSDRVQRWVQQEARGNAQKVLNLGLLRELAVPLPPLEEQRRIAAVLSSVDAAIDKTESVIAQVVVVSHALTSGLLDRGTRGRASSWPIHPLGDLIAEGPTNGVYLPLSEYGSGTPIVRIDAFSHGDALDCSVLPLKRVRSGVIEAGRFAVREGDLLINRVNSLSHLGKSAVIDRIVECTIFESNMMRVRFDTQRILSRFALLWLTSDLGRKQVRDRAKQAVAQASINQEDVRQMRLRLPPIEEQVEIVAVAKSARERGMRETAKLNGLRKVKAALLDALLSGRMHSRSVGVAA